jgi:hypothetical protein
MAYWVHWNDCLRSLQKWVPFHLLSGLYPSLEPCDRNTLNVEFLIAQYPGLKLAEGASHYYYYTPVYRPTGSALNHSSQSKDGCMKHNSFSCHLLSCLLPNSSQVTLYPIITGTDGCSSTDVLAGIPPTFSLAVLQENKWSDCDENWCSCLLISSLKDLLSV